MILRILISVLIILAAESAYGQAIEGVNSDVGTSLLTVMSYNLRYDTTQDGINSWPYRREQVSNLIQFHSPDFVGIQEGLLHQLQFLDSQLPRMKRIGVGRNNGDDDGEFSSIYYNSDRFELVADTDRTIWLSESPDIPSQSWDAALPRILTFGKFRDLANGNEFYMFNTHFDHIGTEARKESAKIILEIIRNSGETLPVVLTGDFNVDPGSEVYAILNADTSPVKDAYFRSRLPHIGPEFTAGGFNINSTGSLRRIDYIFVNDLVTVDKHAILATFRDGRYPSDHLPVFTSLRIEQ